MRVVPQLSSKADPRTRMIKAKYGWHAAGLSPRSFLP
jgi:hypothetical protein